MFFTVFEKIKSGIGFSLKSFCMECSLGTHRERNCKNKIIMHQNDNTVELKINFMNMTMCELNTQKCIVVSAKLSFH